MRRTGFVETKFCVDTVGIVNFYPNAIVLDNLARLGERGKIVGTTVIKVDIVMSPITERFSR